MKQLYQNHYTKKKYNHSNQTSIANIYSEKIYLIIHMKRLYQNIYTNQQYVIIHTKQLSQNIYTDQ